MVPFGLAELPLTVITPTGFPCFVHRLARFDMLECAHLRCGRERDMRVPDFKAGFTALNRFGFGARGDGDLAAAASDPRGFLKAELAQPGIALLEGPGMPRTALALQALFADQEQKKAERERMAAEASGQPAMTAADTAMAANPNSTA